ncbi:MAG: hypothetical protein ABJA02_01265 [Acidobacteriota bacterium]
MKSFCRAGIIAVAVILFAGAARSQVPVKSDVGPVKEVGPIRSSAAYAETLLRRTELQADLEAMLPDYTEENPKVLDARFEIAVLSKDMDRLFGVRPSETGRLTEALGRMIVRRAALATDLSRLLRSYSKDHPEVKRAKRRVEIFDAAIKEILG